MADPAPKPPEPRTPAAYSGPPARSARVSRILRVLIRGGVIAVLSLLIGIGLFYFFLSDVIERSTWFPSTWRPTVVIVTAVGASTMFGWLHIYPHLSRADSQSLPREKSKWRSAPRWLFTPSLGSTLTWFATAIAALGLYVIVCSCCFIGTENDLFVPLVIPEELQTKIDGRGGIIDVANTERDWLRDQLDHTYPLAMGMTSALLLFIYTAFILSLTASFSLSFSVVEGVLEYAVQSWIG